ncbi:sulfur reduction protein DsrE [Salinimicrobium flavum]|uniref:Sulfur reduction protein DsrE n=1 Tax=Salinimicrobium flavum TaxID=1737065 RepID=A0ABW5J120_9FLAO
MKKTLLLSIALLLTIFSTNAQTHSEKEHSEKEHSEKEHSEKINYVVLTRQVPQLKPILLAAEELAKQDGKNFGDFQVVVCGKTVQELTNEEAMKVFLEQAEEAGVTINACGFSLKKFGVDKTKLHPNIKVADNGILYNFELQKKGYLSIEL